jgi:hypothetical protein
VLGPIAIGRRLGNPAPLPKHTSNSRGGQRDHLELQHRSQALIDRALQARREGAGVFGQKAAFTLLLLAGSDKSEAVSILPSPRNLPAARPPSRCKAVRDDR